jgi:ABC-type nitrate/sulfonate/bicarbonate transport system substrate-binding protein
MTATPASPRPIRVNIFPGGFNWGLYAGQEQAFFAAEGLALELQNTPNSISQMTGLAEGKFDIAMTAIDNIVAYVEGQGEASIGPQPEFFAFMGSDSGFLNLMALPEVQGIGDLAGRTVSVDAFTTGYAFVLYEVLRRSGLNREAGDYAVVSAGGTAQRWKALAERKQHATLLSAPFSIIAREAGFVNLGRAVEILGHYQGNVAAARRSWATQNRTQIVAFVRAYHKSISWLYAPANRPEAIEILRRHVPDLTPDAAQAAYDELLAPRYGFFPDCRIDLAGVECVLALRRRYFAGAGPLSDPMKYCDFSFRESAG